ncbi:MAG: hypothetical protein IJ859_07610 [Synergistaceae bacterium]|nr:hypothetical protein [Synergistaceae bacterium]
MTEALAYKNYEEENIIYRMPMLRSEVNILRHDIDTLKTDVSELKRDVNTLKSDVSDLKKDVSILKDDVSELKSEMKDVRSDVGDLKGEMKTLSVRVDSVEKRLDDMNNSQNKWFMVLSFLVAAVPIAIAIIQNFIRR